MIQRRLGVTRIIGCIAVLALIIFGCFFFVESHNGNAQNKKGQFAELIKENVLYHVDKVLDGDTLVVDVAGHEVVVRLIGMDTPEVVDPRKPVQCFGPEASAKAKELLSGKEIYIERESNREAYDKYGRVLAYAHFPDGSLYNQFMIEEGYAREYTFNKEKYKYQKEFREAEVKAKEKKLGIWSKCVENRVSARAGSLFESDSGPKRSYGSKRHEPIFIT